MGIKTVIRRKYEKPLKEYAYKVEYPGKTFKKVKLRRIPMRSSQTISLPPLRHDFINFKVMSGNEILLNMENAEFFRDEELVNSIIELSRRKGQEQHDWEIHPYTKIVLEQISKRMGRLSATLVSQVAYALDKLNINNVELWNNVAKHADRLAHVLDSRSIANFLNVFVPQPSEELEDDVVYLDKEIEKVQKSKRWSQATLEQLVRVLPLKVKDLKVEELIRTLEVWFQRDLGSEKLYKEYLLFYIERKVQGFSFSQYLRLLKVLGDLQYSEDTIFWNDYIFPRIYKKPLNQKYAKLIWDSLIALKVKCPDIDCDIPIDYVESILQKFKSIEEYESYEQEIKDSIRYYGDLPEGMEKYSKDSRVASRPSDLFEQAQEEITHEAEKEYQTQRLNDPEYKRKKELREARKLKRENKEASQENVLYDSD